MPRGRRTKLTPAMQEQICEHISQGLLYVDACRLADIDPATFHRWRVTGEQATKGIHYDFCKAIKKAEADFKAHYLRQIECAADEKYKRVKKHVKEMLDAQGNRTGNRTQEVTEEEVLPDWKAAAWLLERKYPEEFGRRVVQHDGKIEGGGISHVQVEFIGPEEPAEDGDDDTAG